MNVAAQTVADSAVIGDYDTITETLERSIANSHFRSVSFIESRGGVVKAGRIDSACTTARARHVGRIQGLHVLLVEDHPVNQKLATTLLKQWGHIVQLANNGQEAVALFPTRHWDLVLMDMQMPVMGGLEATRLIRASEPVGQRTPIIAMTAEAMALDRTACLEAGMDDHLSKPFKAAALQAMVVQFVKPKADIVPSSDR